MINIDLATLTVIYGTSICPLGTHKIFFEIKAESNVSPRQEKNLTIINRTPGRDTGDSRRKSQTFTNTD